MLTGYTPSHRVLTRRNAENGVKDGKRMRWTFSYSVCRRRSDVPQDSQSVGHPSGFTLSVSVTVSQKTHTQEVEHYVTA